jgi:hypothetical protein
MSKPNLRRTASVPRGHGITGQGIEGRLATDIVEAAFTLVFCERRDKRIAREAKAAARKAAITLHRAPWDPPA